MSNLYEAPFQVGEKTASNEPNELARILTSGNTDDFNKILSAEDKAFFQLSEGVIAKLASFQPLSKDDVGKLDEAEINALTVLGKNAMYKVAAYVDFLAQAEEYEKIGRALAQHVMLSIKTASDQREHVIETMAEHPRFIEATKIAAKAELEKRKGSAAEKK